MAAPPGELFRIGQQSTLPLDHLPRREPLPALLVQPQPHQLGRRRDLQIGVIELFLAVGSSIQEPPDIVMRKRRPLPAQGLQRNDRIGNDLRAVGVHDPLLLGHPIRQELRELRIVLPRLAHADFAARDQRLLLLGIGAMIDAHGQACLSQMLVGDLRPGAPRRQ